MRDVARAFLEKAGWADARAHPVAGDLSARHYTRLEKNGATVILMDALADRASTESFVNISTWLRSLGLSAPKIHAAQCRNGLLLLEDFGETKVEMANEEEVMSECLRVLAVLRAGAPPMLPAPTPSELVEWTYVADEYLIGAELPALAALRGRLEQALIQIDDIPKCVSLRDFHVDNLMWLTERASVQRLGLLDFQDAFICHPVYDLVSLLTDARTDVSQERRAAAKSAYLARSNDDCALWDLAFAAYSIQRNLRILGVFCRAAKLHNKTHHLPKLGRVKSYIAEALEHPFFAPLRDDVLDALTMSEGAQ